MACTATLIFGGVEISIPVIVDSGSQEEIILEEEDINLLGLGKEISQRSVQYPDHSIGSVAVYADVQVILTLTDGSQVRATVQPVRILPSTHDVPQVGVQCTERILGFPALAKLNLKLDFKNKILVRRVRRI